MVRAPRGLTAAAGPYRAVLKRPARPSPAWPLARCSAAASCGGSRPIRVTVPGADHDAAAFHGAHANYTGDSLRLPGSKACRWCPGLRQPNGQSESVAAVAVTGLRMRGRGSRPPRRGENPMARPQPKISLSASRDIPFNKLVLSQANVRRIKVGVAIEELAEDIARRSLLQSLTVRPVLDESGAETGMYEVPAGGRRYRALELLVKQKRLPRTTPIPCIVRTGGIAEEDSLAENVHRAPLHPLDQFRAFLALREKGKSEEEIAAAFFVSVAVVRQRLRLAAVSPKLLEVYAEDGMTLDQLMAFTVNPNHARQEQVWDALQRSPIRQPYQIRRLLTEDAVRAADKRAQFVGIAEYKGAGGSRTRRCSTGSLPRSWSGKRRPSVRRGGSGSRLPPISPTGTPTACAVSAAARWR